VLLAECDGLVPGGTGGLEQVGLDEPGVDLVHGGAVLAHHPQHRLAVLRVAGERAGHLGDAGAGAVGVPGHEGGDRPCPGPAAVGVVGLAERHQQRPQVGVPQPELPEVLGVLGDPLGRVRGVPDDDLLGQEDDLDGVPERGHVELAIIAEKLEQIQARQIAS
jgi:hypothetical protein